MEQMPSIPRVITLPSGALYGLADGYSVKYCSNLADNAKLSIGNERLPVFYGPLPDNITQ